MDDNIMGTNKITNAQEAWENSNYYKIDFKIDQDATVYEAVEKFSYLNISCLVVTRKSDGMTTGIISERDYVCKIALEGRSSKETYIKDIMTKKSNIIVVKRNDSLTSCMKKMLCHGIRHLPVVDECHGDVIGMISTKDLLRETVKEK